MMPDTNFSEVLLAVQVFCISYVMLTGKQLPTFWMYCIQAVHRKLSRNIKVICIFLFTLISNQKTSLHCFLWANALSQLAVV